MADDLHAELAAMLPRLRRFGEALTGSRAEADDLVQDACERVLTRSVQLRERARLDAWVYGIIRHLWLDRRRAARVRRHESIDVAEAMPGDNEEARAADRLTLAAVRTCLEDLAVEHRAVLMLVCVDGLSYREASDVLDIPIGTVMSRLARGRIALQQRLRRAQPAASFSPAATNIVPLVERRPRRGGDSR